MLVEHHDGRWRKLTSNWKPRSTQAERSVGIKEHWTRDGKTTSTHTRQKQQKPTEISRTARPGSPRHMMARHGTWKATLEAARPTTPIASRRLHIFVSQSSWHPRVMSRSLPHLTLTTSTSSLSPTSPLFPTPSPSHPGPLAHDPCLPCDDSRQSGGSTQIPSLTGCEPKVIEPEDLEPRRIELDRNLGTDPSQERIM